MVSESRYYKDDLLAFAHEVGQWLRHRRFTDRRWVAFERGLLWSCLVVRRLIESHKIADDLAGQLIDLETYASLGQPVTVMNRHDLMELYDVANPKVVARPLSFVTNQAIHSYVLSYWLEVDRAGITVFFSSDRERNRRAYSISTRRLLPLLRTIGSDYPDCATFAYDAAKQDFAIHHTTADRSLRRVPKVRSRLSWR